MSLRVTRSQTRERSTEPISERTNPSTKTKATTPPEITRQITTTASASQPLAPVSALNHILQSIAARYINPTQLHLPEVLQRKHTKLDTKTHQLLLQKQAKLRQLNLIESFPSRDRFVSHSPIARRRNGALLEFESLDTTNRAVLERAIASTYIFASENAGTAVAIHSPIATDDDSDKDAGPILLLTCGHCIAESRDEFDVSTRHWLLSAAGDVIQAKCVAWDERRDLALLVVIAMQRRQKLPTTIANNDNSTTTAIELSLSTPKPKTPIICIGHPGSEDLEAEESGIATDYPVLTISEGRFMGYAKGQDIQDNSEIGALMHDAWTYWGHSGAPIVDVSTGCLIGLHSSWDDESGMRRGVGGEAVVAFLGDVLRTDVDGEGVVLLPR